MDKLFQYAELIRVAGLTQSALCAEIGISTRTFSDWSVGRTRPTFPKHRKGIGKVFKKYGVAYDDAAAVPDAPPAPDVVPDVDCRRLRAARVASGLSLKAYAQSLGLIHVSMYYKYENGKARARLPHIRQALYEASLAVDPVRDDAAKEENKLRTRNPISVDRLAERIERFERVKAPEQEALWVKDAIAYASLEFDLKPALLREAIATVLGTLRGRVPLANLLSLIAGAEL